MTVLRGTTLKGQARVVRRLQGFQGIIGVVVTPQLLKSGELGAMLGRDGSAFVEAALARSDFKATHLSSVVITGHPSAKVRAIIAVGWNSQEESDDAGLQWRRLGSAFWSALETIRYKGDFAIDLRLIEQDVGAIRGVVEGLLLSSYVFDEYKSKKAPRASLSLVVHSAAAHADKEVREGEILSDATAYVRDLVNRPARECTPAYLVKEARKLAKDGMKVSVIDKRTLRKRGAHLMLSVFDGSNAEPFLVRIHYKPRGATGKRIALVGKGVTFDSGGLSIKSGPGMFDMKADMAGAGAVLGTLQALSKLKVPVEVIAYLPLTENMICPSATMPGDVVTALNGKTVEILNTDAEGRLVLADALVMAEREKPDAIVDIGTLTGSIVSALGSSYAGVFSRNSELSQSLLRAASSVGERLWPMPLPSEYKARLKSTTADVKNIGGAEAGSILCALFLSEFVDKTPWAHLDIAAPAYLDADRWYMKKGGTGYGVRTLVEYVRKNS